VSESGTEPNVTHATSKEQSRELRAKRKELRERLSEYRRRGELDDAIAYLQCALKERSYPERTIFEQLAEVYAATEQFELALGAVRRMIELGDASPEAELELAILQAKTRNISLARNTFAKLVSANPELHQAQFEYGCFLCEQGELDQGTTLIDRAIALALGPISAGRGQTSLEGG
jgi:tetratricopeptide (TPR) repeat protein